MSEIKHSPQRPAYTVRRGSVNVSLWKWVDQYGLRYEFTVDRAYDLGESQSRYPERFRAEHIGDLRAAIDQAAEWLRIREEKNAEVRRLFESSRAPA